MKPLLDVILDINRDYLKIATSNDVLDAIKARAINNGAGYRDWDRWDVEQMLVDINILLREAWLEGKP